MRPFPLVTLAVLLIACATSDGPAPPPAGAVDPDAAVDALSRKLVRFMRKGGDVAYLVMPIFHRGAPCLLGERLGAKLQSRIEDEIPGAKAVLSPADDALLEDALARQHSDLFDSESGIPALGELHGHRYEVHGRLLPTPGRDDVCWARVRVVDLERGTHTAAEALILATPGSLDRLPEASAGERSRLSMRFGCLLTDPSGLNAGARSDAFDVRVDDRSEIRFLIDSDADAWVYLLSVGTSGRATLVFPNPFHPAAALREGESVTIPPRATVPEWPPFVFEGAKGTERFFLVASLRPPADTPLLRDLDALGRIRLTGDGAASALAMPAPLPADRTAALVRRLREARDGVSRRVRTRKLFELVGEGRRPDDIRVRDLALPRPAVLRSGTRTERFAAPPLEGGELLVEEFTVDHL